ncbi:MAG TPA: efflux RND transporter periplasmic adaptor subunit [Puia sp.]
MRKKNLYYSICLIGFTTLYTSCGNNPAKTNSSAQGQNQLKEYAVLTLVPKKAIINSDFPATIQGQQNVEIRPKIDGYLTALYVDEGSVVKKNQLLFRISAETYEQGVRTAEANVKIAQADLDAAQMQVNKVKPLVQKDIISKYELIAAQNTVEAKEAALAQANATLVNAKVSLGYSTIYSPIDGLIGSIPFKIGSLVSSTNTQPLTTVSNIKNIYAYFSINEKDQLDFFMKVAGKTLQEKLATFPSVTLMLANGSEFSQKGRIETIGGLIDPQTGSITLRATFPNPSGLIRSGSSALVRLPVTIDTALLVPQKATYQVQGKLFVYLVGPGDSVKSVSIQANANTTGHSYVVEKGLKPGDRIVIEGISNLREGLPIKPKTVVNTDSVYNSL